MICLRMPMNLLHLPPHTEAVQVDTMIDFLALGGPAEFMVLGKGTTGGWQVNRGARTFVAASRLLWQYLDSIWPEKTLPQELQAHIHAGEVTRLEDDAWLHPSAQRPHLHLIHFEGPLSSDALPLVQTALDDMLVDLHRHGYHLPATTATDLPAQQAIAFDLPIPQDTAPAYSVAYGVFIDQVLMHGTIRAINGKLP